VEEERPRQLLGKGPSSNAPIGAGAPVFSATVSATVYLKSADYPHYLLDAVEVAFGKPRDRDNRKALVDFTFDDFDEALARDPMIVAARLEEERDRVNGFACSEADV
jgi:hypothetical protein